MEEFEEYDTVKSADMTGAGHPLHDLTAAIDKPAPNALNAGSRLAFPVTVWGLVSRGGGAESPERQIALETILVRYLPVLQAYVTTRFRVAPERADDWLQAFIMEKVLEKDLLAQARPERGKFRSFLVKTLQNYIIQQLRKEACRGGAPGASVSWDELPPNTHATMPPPTAVFDLPWAQQVLREALRRMKQDCLGTGRQVHWAVFSSRLLQPLLHGGQPVPYETLTRQVGLAQVEDACTLLLSAKRMFSRHFRSVVAEYTANDDLIEQEIQDIKDLICTYGIPSDLRLAEETLFSPSDNSSTRLSARHGPEPELEKPPLKIAS
jgi:DNA-directed RNA polymerase specialized sigma24 family protein